MLFGYTHLIVPDVAAATAFYQRAFGLAVRFAHEGGDYTELETGATVLALVAEPLMASHLPGGPDSFVPNQPHQPAPGVCIALVTDDVKAAFDRAWSAGAQRVSPPSQKPWGQWVAYVRDPNGVLVELCSPVG